MNKQQPLLQINNLSLAYGVKEILKAVQLTVCPGEILGIVGSSGGGKSTFLRCLNLLEKPTSGQILIDGVDICAKGQSKHIDQHRQKMGMVFQQFNLFNNMTVIENIMMAPVYVRCKELKKAKSCLLYTSDAADEL